MRTLSKFHKIIENDDSASLLDSPDMESEARETIEQLPDPGIEGMHDVEELSESMSAAFWEAYFSNGLREAFNLKNFITEYVKTHGDATVDDIVAALPNDTPSASYYKKHKDILTQKMASMMGTTTSMVAQSKPFDPESLTNDLAKELAGSSAENRILSAAESAQDKFDSIRSVARTILQGKGIKHHGFIYGDAGCGKSSHYDEKIPVRMDDAIAEAFEAFLKSRNQ